MKKETAKGRGWITLVIFLIILGLPAGWYFNQGQKQFTHGMTAYDALDCSTAYGHFDRITNTYWLAFFPSQITQVRALKTECNLLNQAAARLQQGDYAAA